MGKTKRALRLNFLRLLVATLLVGGAAWFQTVDVYWTNEKPDKVETVGVTFPSGGLNLSGRIYRPKGRIDAAGRPAVVLLHGTNPRGSHLLLYRLLAEELCRSGTVVFIYDQRGYAASPDPPHNGDGTLALDFVGDAVRAVQFIAAKPYVDPSRIVLAGHSFGGSVAVGVSHVPHIERLVQRILVISPGRGWPYQGDQRFIFRRRRLTQDMELNKPIRLETIRALYRNFEVETLLERNRAIYIRLINGEREEHLKPLTGIYAKMSPPKDIRIVPGTGHYFNTNYLFNRLDFPMKIYRADKIRQLAKAIQD